MANPTVNYETLIRITRAISTIRDPEEIVLITVEGVTHALAVKGCALFLFSESSDELKLAGSYGLSEEYLNKRPVFAEESMGLCLKGESVGVKAFEREQYRHETMREGIVSMLCVPIRAGEEVIGTMKLYSIRDEDIAEDSLTLVNALALQGGQAIQNASQYLLLQEDKKNLEEDIWTHKTWF